MQDYAIEWRIPGDVLPLVDRILDKPVAAMLTPEVIAGGALAASIFAAAKLLYSAVGKTSVSYLGSVANLGPRSTLNRAYTKLVGGALVKLRVTSFTSVIPSLGGHRMTTHAVKVFIPGIPSH